MKDLQALLFDVDGTLADTERDGHRVAFNRAFREWGLDWDWGVALYGQLLAVTGGKERILYYLERFRPEFPRPDDLSGFVAELHKAKTRHYTEMLGEGAIPLRPGVKRLLAEAKAAGLRLAVATTTTPANVSALLDSTLGADASHTFELIAAGDIVPRKKPAPDIYVCAMGRMSLSPERCLALEDSRNGVRSARDAGIQSVVVTVNDYTRAEDFTGASLVVDTLGEPGAPPRVLEGLIDQLLCCASCTASERPMDKVLAARLAPRMAQIQPFHVMKLLARARALEAQGRSIIHMEIGEPDFPTPEPIVEAASRALACGATHYTPARGLPELRSSIAEHYRRTFGVSLSPDRVLVTPGASGALQLLVGALIGPGDGVLMADPGYPCNRHFVRLAEGVPQAVPVGPESRYQLDAAAVEAAWTPDTRAVLVATPSNPTGTTLSLEALAAIDAVRARHGGMLLVDEIYQGLIYSGHPRSVLEVADDALVVNSFSKYFGMTGWRLGWLVAPPEYVEPLDRLAQNIFLAAPTLSQHAALAAFSEQTEAILEERREAFQARRDFLLPALRALGFVFAGEPEGAFYLYGDASALASDSFGLAEALLEEAGVAVTPGVDFGSNLPERHLRFAYTTALPRLEEGVERIRRFLAAGS